MWWRCEPGVFVDSRVSVADSATEVVKEPLAAAVGLELACLLLMDPTRTFGVRQAATQLTRGEQIVVDEAGMLDQDTAYALLTVADEHGVQPAFSRQQRGPRHDSIEDAIMDAGEEGTRSILDIHTVSNRAGFGTAAPFPKAAYMELYGTERPTQSDIRANKDFLRWASPAQCIYILLYEKNAAEPTQVLFAGRSFG